MHLTDGDWQNDTRFLGFDDNVAGTYLSHQLPSRAHVWGVFV